MKVVYQYTVDELRKSRTLPEGQDGLSQLHYLIQSGKPLVLQSGGKPATGIIYRLNDNGNHDPGGNNFEMHLTVAF